MESFLVSIDFCVLNRPGYVCFHFSEGNVYLIEEPLLNLCMSTKYSPQN